MQNSIFAIWNFKYAAHLEIWLHSMNCEDGPSAAVVQHLGGKHPEAGSRGKQIFVSWFLLEPWLMHTSRISKASLTDEINLQLRECGLHLSDRVTRMCSHKSKER